jgi:hypothetical protein
VLESLFDVRAKVADLHAVIVGEEEDEDGEEEEEDA